MRGLILALSLVTLPATAAEIVSARYDAPTTRYAHAVLGDDVEYGALVLEVRDCAACAAREVTHTLPQNRVFEDLAPRLADLDGDGLPEVVTVESDARQGAQLAIYSARGKIAETPFIGRSFRWLAPAGIADFDGDGQNDIAYVETPHLGKTLRFWTLRNGDLTQIAATGGVTNHRIGEDFITSAVRDCDGRVSVLMADARWRRVIGTHLSPDGPVQTDFGLMTDLAGLRALASCM
ncbi:hypothetical protein FHS89_000201 [Rubricella aquisinus]|uniref:Repeat domain-containing protein n=1 Tax=Rubricella aquisinus TaxID=2028108 RepID=A0A840WJ21_9RHOB|nr:VCBS repeat-containing protein [Rubricella aquisinus]MBB5514203.1 hypothetical protein [Rubricella aquisinus]